jgi:hypothetical protein
VVIQNVIIEQIIGKYLNNIIDNRSIIYYNHQGNTQVLPCFLWLFCHTVSVDRKCPICYNTL